MRIDLHRRRPFWRWLHLAWVVLAFSLGLVLMHRNGPPEASGGAFFVVVWCVVGVAVSA